jgi:hypothetical protein
MWIINNDTKKWTSNTDKLPISDFQALKQDLKSLRFYQRVLSGATFVRIDDTNDIYNILNYQNKSTYIVLFIYFSFPVVLVLWL